MTPLLAQYENKNSRRKYPFADSASMRDLDGQLLPTDFIIDACLYPLDLQGVPYVAEINPLTRTILIADSSTAKVFGQATYSGTDLDLQTSVQVFETAVYERPIGVLAFGAGRGDVWRGRAIRTFTAEATTFTPTAFVPINQVGVRGILLPDGTLMVGDVTIEGIDGILVTSRIESDMCILRFDVLGVPPVDDQDCGSTPPICTIEVKRIEGSAIMIARYDDNTLALTAPGITLDGICAQAQARRRVNFRDPCEELPPVPEPIPPGDPVTETFSVCAGQGSFMIVAPSAIGYINPLAVQPIPPGMPAPKGILTPPGMTIDELNEATDQFRLPQMDAGGIIIGFQGLGQDQLP